MFRAPRVLRQVGTQGSTALGLQRGDPGPDRGRRWREVGVSAGKRGSWVNMGEGFPSRVTPRMAQCLGATE